MQQSRLLDAKKNQNGSRTLLESFFEVRSRTEELCAPLETEDFVIQSMDDVSPPKWHLGHTSWFFETFLLTRYIPDYKPYEKLYGYLFNSYYETIGDRWARANRGLLSRPTVKEVLRYRAYINDRMHDLLKSFEQSRGSDFAFLVELGLHHEQQHQELLLTDIKHLLSINPSKPVYSAAETSESSSVPSRFVGIQGGVCEVGYAGSDFSFDNERPRHRVWLNDYQLQKSNGEYVLKNVTKNGLKQVFKNLVFHGGKGATLEMRVFSESSLMREFQRAGFRNVTIHKTPNFEHGIYWQYEWSLILSARR